MPTMHRPHLDVSDSSFTAQDAVEQERLRLAHDLHDDLGSLLIAAKMAMTPFLNGSQKNVADLKAAAARANALIDQAIDAMHRTLHDLRPPELKLGLVAALAQMATDYQLQALPCDFSSNQAEIDVAPEVTLGLLRICREALTNVSKHAAASRVVLHLVQQPIADAADATNTGDTAVGDMLMLDIIDDGRGYPAEAPAGASIERRVRALGGTLERPASASGCHLKIRIPIPFPARHRKQLK
ncbi:MAG: domain S-box protein [Herbaspirillum sp.]|nr:domain S-box protein [Herbaspirillum sp.]